ncbi:MAG: anti-sigma factor [Gemmatimonadaceae bacterium]
MTDQKIMSCEEALRLLAAHIDGELDAADQDDVEHHIERCRSCFSRAEFERRLKGQLTALREEPVRPTFETRIRALIDRFALNDSSSSHVK